MKGTGSCSWHGTSHNHFPLWKLFETYARPVLRFSSKYIRIVLIWYYISPNLRVPGMAVENKFIQVLNILNKNKLLLQNTSLRSNPGIQNSRPPHILVRGRLVRGGRVRKAILQPLLNYSLKEPRESPYTYVTVMATSGICAYKFKYIFKESKGDLLPLEYGSF